MTNDTFRTHGRNLTAPSEYAVTIQPSDSSGLPYATRAIYVGTAGDLRVRMLGHSEVTFVNIPQGAVLPLRVTQVFATGTTAANMVGLW
jgi:hypothetical protein